MLLTNYLLYRNFYPLKKVGIVLKNFMKEEKMEFNENTKLFQKYMEKIKEIMEGTIKFEDIKLSANGSLAKNWGLLK